MTGLIVNMVLCLTVQKLFEINDPTDMKASEQRRRGVLIFESARRSRSGEMSGIDRYLSVGNLCEGPTTATENGLSSC